MPPRKVVSKRSFVDQSLVGTRRPAGTQREYLGTVEARWDCSSCGHKDIPGGTKNCPACGNPKDGGETYQPPESQSAPYLTTQQLSNMGVNPATHESDEECPYCGSRLNPGTQVCPHCNGNIKNAARSSRHCPNCGRETNGYACPNCGADTQSKSTPIIEEEPVFSLPKIEMPDLGGINWTTVGGVLLAILMIGGLLFAFWPREERATVSQANWTSTVYLQEYQYNQHGDWSIPAGGDYVSEETRIHHYDKVYDHTERQCHMETQSDGYDTETYTDTECHSEYSHTEQTCYDDGTCDSEAVYENVCENVTRERQVPRYKQVEVCENVDIYRDEPRYATWYTYNIWEWVNITPAVVSGTGFEPYWPSDFRVDEKHRESGRVQTYSITFQVKDKTYSYTPTSFDEYIRYQIGSEWIIKRSGNVVLEVKLPEEK